jgi:hypothetical protein
MVANGNVVLPKSGWDQPQKVMDPLPYTLPC